MHVCGFNRSFWASFSPWPCNATDCIHCLTVCVNYYHNGTHAAFPPIRSRHFVVISRCICVQYAHWYQTTVVGIKSCFVIYTVMAMAHIMIYVLDMLQATCAIWSRSTYFNHCENVVTRALYEGVVVHLLSDIYQFTHTHNCTDKVQSSELTILFASSFFLLLLLLLKSFCALFP